MHTSPSVRQNLARTAFIALIWLLAMPALTSEKVYRWVDEDGVVNFTQQKPRDNVAQEIDVTVTSVVRNPAVVFGDDRTAQKHF